MTVTSHFFVAVFLAAGQVFAGPLPPQLPSYPTEADYSNCDLITFPSPKSDLPKFVEIFDGSLVEGDIEGETESRNGVADNKRWDGGRIPYVISDRFTEAERVKIMKAICEYGKKTDGLRFTPRKNVTQKAYVLIETKASGCSATVGMKGSGVQFVHLGPSCSLGSTMHELMHAAGFWHEQTRPDRNNHIDINWANIQPGKEHNFEIRDTSTTFGLPYDFSSQMHYSGKAFAKDSKVWTLKPKNSFATIGLRTGPSVLDIKKLNAMYPLCAKGYSEQGFNGSVWTFTNDTMNNLEPVGEMRSAVIEKGCVLRICKERNLDGECKSFAGETKDFRVEFPVEWDRAAASFECYCENVVLPSESPAELISTKKVVL